MPDNLVPVKMNRASFTKASLKSRKFMYSSQIPKVDRLFCEIVIQRWKEVAKDLQRFIRLCGMTMCARPW
jgi:hypothetical protein